MSFYLKLIVVLILGTYGAQFLIKEFVVNTNAPKKITRPPPVPRTTHVPRNFGNPQPKRPPTEQELTIAAAEARILEANKRRAEIVEGRDEGYTPTEVEMAILEAEQMAIANAEARIAQEVQRRDAMVASAGAVYIPPVPMSPDAQNTPARSNTTVARANKVQAPNPNRPKRRADSDSDTRVRGNIGGNKINSVAKPKPNRNPKPKPVSQTRLLTTTKLNPPVKLVHALDLAYAAPLQNNCSIPGNQPVVVGVNYRRNSYAIKGASLNNIDQLIRLYTKCKGGTMLVLPRPEALTEKEVRYLEQRQNEVKYYLLQRKIKKDDILYSDTP